MFLSGCFLVIGHLASIAQSTLNSEKDQVKQTLVHLFEGFAKMDIVKVKNFITDDFTLIEDGTLWNTDSVTVHFEEFKNQLKDAKFDIAYSMDFVQITIIANTASVVYHNAAESSINGNAIPKLQWIESAFLIKEGTEWKVKLLHSTEIKP